MSCSLGTYPSTRQVAPAVSVAALRAAAERLQSASAAGSTLDTRRPNYLLDVPVSAAEVDRWERRWQEAKATPTLASASPSTGANNANTRGPRAGTYFQTATIAYAARTSNEDAPTSSSAAAAPTAVATTPTHHLAPFPAFVFASVKTPPMTQLLKLRRQWLPHRQRFPLHQQRMGFLDAVLNHAVVALVGPAGSGRTLQVPIVLSETEVLKRRRLVVVSANATAARLTVLRLREERGEDMQRSRTVAAALPNLVEANESTSVVVTTADVLLRQLQCDPCLENVGCVVIDDAHIRSESTELCLSLLRDLLAVQQQSEQQQQQQQQQAGTAANGATGSDAAQGSPDATRRRRLHVVLNCPDETNASTLLTFLAPSRCKATTFTLQAPSSLLMASTTLYLEETVQWLLKCEKEGSCLVRDGGVDGAGGTVENALLSYAENVDAVARIMAAGDANFARPAAFRQYWLPLVCECVDQYDRAERQARSNGEKGRPGAPLPAILIVAPSNYHVHVITRAMQEAQESAAEGDVASLRVCTALAEDSLFANFVTAAQRTAVKDVHQRWIVVATSELSQTVLPSSMDIGLVVDCARNTFTAVDATTMADMCTTEYSSITQLRYRRRLAKVQAADGPAAHGSGTGPLAPVVIQLIPKSVLHSAQHRRLNVDPAQHPVFRLPFQRYVQLYQVLLAREEAVLAQRAAVTGNFGGTPHNSNESSPTVAAKIGPLLSSLLIGVPAATANKYDAVRRVMAAVESYLRAAAHIAQDNDAGSLTNGRLTLQPMGVLSLCLPVPFAVGRLLVSGAVLRPSLAALTAIGALWCCSDLLSLQGVGVVAAADASDATREAVEEQTALLGEARLFFSRDSLSDVVSAFHVYQMWCSVRGKADEESDFLEECGVSRDVLSAVFETQLGLCAMLRSFHLFVPPPGTEPEGAADAPVSGVDRAESTEERVLRSCIASFASTAEAAAALREALGAAMTALSQEVSANRALHACVTAALYPSCIVPTGEDGVGLLYDAIPIAGGAAGAEAGSGAGPATGGRRVATFAQDSLLADAAQASKAAGRPFLFLAKSLADDTTRDAAGATSTASTAVVEQLNPLHEAAAFVFCGHSYERPRKAPLRCRGWSSMLTKSWRETRRARGLPPVAQLPPTSIAVPSYDTVHCQQVVCTMDQNFSVTMRATTSRWLQQLRTHVRGQLATLVRGVPAKSGTSAYPIMGAELADAWAWWERRHAHGKEWLREERVVVASAQQQQQQQEKDDAGEEKSGESAHQSAARAAAMRQRLYGYYQWRLEPGAPPTVVMPTNADRKAAAKSAAAAAAASASAMSAGVLGASAADSKAAGDDENEEAANADSGLPATYTGKLPRADVDHIFRQCARSVAARGTREAEARLLRDSPDMFYFLNPEDPFHEYYLYLLRQAAPDMEVLGDNLEELITFLEGVETELREELGYVDPAVAAAASGSGGGVLGDDVAGTYTAGANMWGDSTIGKSSGGAGGDVYEVHDVVEEEGEGEDGDMYAGDGGGLQLESAAVNLKKNAGPTLAEQIEQARRTQTSTSTSTTGTKGDGGAGTAGGQHGFSNLANTTGSSGMAGGAGNGAAPTSSTTTAGMPFVSTNAGATLADKLRAMQMAAMQGNAGGYPPSTAENATAPFINSSDATAAATATSHAAGTMHADYVMPQPTAEDLLAAINFGSEGASAGTANATASPQQPPQQSQGYGYGGASVGTSDASQGIFRAPTTEELMALLGNPSSAPPPSASASGPLNAGFNMGSVLGVLGTTATSMPVNPLLRPPPAMPAKALEDRPASVLIFPIPNCRRHGGNVRLLLAKSLGEALNMRVGPTVIVGRVARVEVPNRNVEARALALKRFQCAEQTVYLLRNDRIVDGPVRERGGRRQRLEDDSRDVEASRERRRPRGDDRGVGVGGALGVPFSGHVVDPTTPDAYADPSAYAGGVEVSTALRSGNNMTPADAAQTPAALRIGVLSSSEDDDDSDSDSSSSSSSSASSASSSASSE